MKRLFFLFIIFFSFESKASFYLEPYIGHDTLGLADNKVTSGLEYDYEFQALHLGVRFGWTFWESLTFGIEYDQSRLGLEGKSYDKKFTNIKMHGKLWGPFIMYKFPSWVKLWVTYLFYSRLEYEEGVMVDDKLVGDGFSFGISYIDIPYIDFSIEYRIHTLDRYFNYEAEVTNPLLHPYNVSQIVFSISTPINL